MQNSATVIDIWVARRLREATSPGVIWVSQVLKRVDISSILWDGVQLYFQNVDAMYHEDIADFIRALMNTREVTIYHSGSEISTLSVISVVDVDGSERELFMREFTALIRSDGEVSSRNIRETSWWLANNNISISYVPNSVHHNIRDITDEELEWYSPDKIDIVQWATRYTVIIMPDSGDENLWSSFVVYFASPSDCRLLDMVLCAFDDVLTFHWVPLENYRIHVLSSEWYGQSITMVFTPQQMEKVLYPKLREIYGDVSYEEAWKHYFHTRVIPKLRWK